MHTDGCENGDMLEVNFISRWFFFGGDFIERDLPLDKRSNVYIHDIRLSSLAWIS